MANSSLIQVDLTEMYTMWVLCKGLPGDSQYLLLAKGRILIAPRNQIISGYLRTHPDTAVRGNPELYSL